jgi:hypothetical protein
MMDFKTAAEMRYNIKPVEAFQEPMVYTKEIQKPPCGVLIAQGFYNGLNYYVKNINGSHPTAYVEIPQGHKAFGKDFCNYELPQLIEVHGGVTYQDSVLLTVDDNGERDHKFVGWDYGHAGDFEGCYIGNNNWLEKNSKRWTVEEIIEECKEAIDQINKMEAN